MRTWIMLIGLASAGCGSVASDDLDVAGEDAGDASEGDANVPDGGDEGGSADADADGGADADTPAEADAEAGADADADVPIGPCGGEEIGGHCWYLGGEERSCDDACTGHGGYDEATRTYAGSSGTNANCDAVLNALGVGGSSVSTLGGSGTGAGCFYMNMADTRYRVADTPTASGATYILSRRACACLR